MSESREEKALHTVDEIAASLGVTLTDEQRVDLATDFLTGLDNAWRPSLLRQLLDKMSREQPGN